MATTTAVPGLIVGVGVDVGVGVGVSVGLGVGVDADLAGATAFVATDRGSPPAVVGLEAAAQIAAATASRTATTPTRAWLGRRGP